MSGSRENTGMEVAIVGMAGRFPGADDLDAFWRNLEGGVESIHFASEEELRAAGVPAELYGHPDYVRATGALRDVAGFDAAFFGYSPREAELMEPAHRLFLEVAWEALEDAGYDPHRVEGAVGVFAGAGHPYYTEHNVRANPQAAAAVGPFQLMLGSSKDFLATRTSYKLNLRGPSVSVQTACSTSLVAVHLAAQALVHGECDLAMAGGSNVIVPQPVGYLYAHGGVMSPDGHCRAFDADARGAQGGSGAGVVLLKRLDDALRDGDTIRAVILGSAVNNDGARKVAFSAPSVEGQAAVIAEALSVADVDPATVQYVEAHGTGTELGDPIEIAALTQAYRARTDRQRYVTVGAVKTNIGHLDTAAGVAGLIKTVLAMEHGTIPPTLHFRAPNPRIGFDGSPFFVSGTGAPWTPEDGAPRRAAVSSFGIGGTNAHVVLEEAPAAAPGSARRAWHLLPLAARSAAALDAATARLAAHLRAHPAQALADVAFTLQTGRREHAHRRVLVARDGEEVAALLEAGHPDRVLTSSVESGHRSVAFLFPGLGDHHVQMARGLYEAEPVFRAEVDRCAALLRPHLDGVDVRDVLFPGAPPEEPAPGAAAGPDLRRMLGRDAAPDPAVERLNRTELAQPAVFVVEWALAKLLETWGIVPEAVVGHSLGEYAAAAVAGVFRLEDALRLVAARARMIQRLPAGAMLAVPLSPEAAAAFLAPETAVATVNAPSLCVVAGPVAAVDAVAARLEAAGHVARRLPTTHAFHSPMMDPLVDEMASLVAGMTLSPPRVPFVSNVTGTWITDDEATSPRYWARHLRETVQFARGVGELLREPGRVLVEVGPGQTLSTFVRQRPPAPEEAQAPVVPTLRYAYDRTGDVPFLLNALGRLWLAGVTPDWAAVHDGEHLRRIPLPTYPWERVRYWLDVPADDGAETAAAPSAGRIADPARWLHAPSWKRAPARPADPDAPAVWLAVAAEAQAARALADALRTAGRDAVAVHAAERFASAGDDAFAGRLDSADDFAAVLEALAGAGREVGAALHAASLGDDAPALGFPSVAALAAAFGRRGGPARVVVATDGACDVTGAEPLHPPKAAVLGAARVAPQEHPGVAVRVVDATDAAPARLAAEALSAADDEIVALRGPHRWTRLVEPLSPANGGEAGPREGGAYLLSGSLPGRNEGLGRHLAAATGAPLLVCDPGLPPRSSWDSAPDADAAARVEAARALEAAGATVVPVATPAAAVAEAERHGGLRGVIHAPALDEGDVAALAAGSSGAWTARLARVTGELEALAAALDGRETGFVHLEGSLAPELGGAGLGRVAAVGAVLAAWAEARARDGLPWAVVGWDRWFGEDETPSGYGMTAGEAAAVLRHVRSLPAAPVVLVSTGALAARRAEARPAAAAPAEAGHARPDLATEFFAPEGELEERVAAMWQELLGIRRIGAHDDFFTLGGHSLLATQIVSRVREQFHLELPLKAVFEAPTVHRFAALVEAALVAEIEALSDEEALELL